MGLYEFQANLILTGSTYWGTLWYGKYLIYGQDKDGRGGSEAPQRSNLPQGGESEMEGRAVAGDDSEGMRGAGRNA